METFVVRIYRGIRASVQELAGTVECVGTGDRVGFSGGDHLLDCLLATHRREDGEQDPPDTDDATEPGEAVKIVSQDGENPDPEEPK